MKMNRFIATITLASALISPVFATAEKQHTQALLEQKLTDIYQQYQLQGDFLLALIDSDGVRFTQTFCGDKSRCADKAHRPVFIASHTKAMTGTLLKRLEELGKVDLDKSVYDYLPGLIRSDKVDAKAITVRQLLNHSAGFTSTMHTFKTAFLGYTQGEQELVDALNYRMLSAKPGVFRYSNTGPIVAAMIAEKVTGKPWQELLKEHLFVPLDMRHTSAKVSDFKEGEILPALEVGADNRLFRSGFYKRDETMHAAGGVSSTLRDLSLWLMANINRDQRLLKQKSSFTELHNSTISQDRNYFGYQRTGYSLGWDVVDYRGEKILTRFGGLGGISFHASFMPDKKLGVIAFSNEERAFALPHLMANYLYNQHLNNESAESIYAAELTRFDTAFQRTSKRAFTNQMRLSQTIELDGMVGQYHIDSAWPDISIKKSQSGYVFKWGVLEGPVVRSGNAARPFIASLGPIARTFELHLTDGKVTGLTHGSLTYKKR